MAAPAGITEGSEVDAVRGGGEGRGSIRVSFFVVMMGEVVEGLNCAIRRGMEGDAVFRSGVDVFENMEGRFVVWM